MRYNDGFVAYLNGKRVAGDQRAGLPNWQSNASVERADGDSLGWQVFNLSTALGDLVAGDNVLAIHVLNVNDASLDLLSQPRLTGDVLARRDADARVHAADDAWERPTPTGSRASSRRPEASVERGFYTTPFQVTLTAPTAGSQVYFTTNGSAPTPG